MRNIAIFGGSSFGQGPWRPGKRVWSIVLFGASDIDFRQAQLEEGTTIVMVLAILGSSKIIVPQEMPVTLTGLSILGTRGMKRSQPKDIPPVSAKALRVRALSFVGCMKITDKP